jgi:D-alanyl-D-alanine carboxypeptidase
MTTFQKYLPVILEEGAREAQRAGADTIEAHHLLLAIAAHPEPSTRDVLGSAGLDYDTIRTALDREYEQSLAVAGVSLAAFDLPRTVTPAERKPQPGASVKLAIERGVAAAGSVRQKDLRPGHLLLGILLAQVGTVPRALTLAGVDPTALAARVQRGLAGKSTEDQT